MNLKRGRHIQITIKCHKTASGRMCVKYSETRLYENTFMVEVFTTKFFCCS